LTSNIKGYGGKTHYTDSQNSDITAPSERDLYHLQFSLQVASPETFGYTLVQVARVWNKFVLIPFFTSVRRGHIRCSQYIVNTALVRNDKDVVEANFDAGVGLVVGVDFMFRMSSASFHSKAVLYIILQLCGTLVCGEAVSLDQVLNR
jgi:hypothetical protein